MWLIVSTEGEGAEETLKSQSSTIKNLEDALTNFQSFIGSRDVLGTFKNVESTMIKMSSQSLALQRNMGGVISNTAEFQNRLIEFRNVLLEYSSTDDYYQAFLEKYDTLFLEDLKAV